MKFPVLTAALVCLSLSLGLAAPPAPPALPIEQALKLAQDHLSERGLAGAHVVGGLTLEDVSLSGRERYWYARWMPAIKLDQKSESGLRINMDGSLVRLTSGGGGSGGGGSSGAGRNDAPGQRRIGVRELH